MYQYRVLILSASTTAERRDITDNHEMPRISRRHSDRGYHDLPGTPKGRRWGEYRFSANQIYELVKGPRAEVMARSAKSERGRRRHKSESTRRS